MPSKASNLPKLKRYLQLITVAHEAELQAILAARHGERRRAATYRRQMRTFRKQARAALSSSA